MHAGENKNEGLPLSERKTKLNEAGFFKLFECVFGQTQKNRKVKIKNVRRYAEVIK